MRQACWVQHSGNTGGGNGQGTRQLHGELFSSVNDKRSPQKANDSWYDKLQKFITAAAAVFQCTQNNCVLIEWGDYYSIHVHNGVKKSVLSISQSVCLSVNKYRKITKTLSGDLNCNDSYYKTLESSSILCIFTNPHYQESLDCCCTKYLSGNKTASENGTHPDNVYTCRLNYVDYYVFVCLFVCLFVCFGFFV